MRFLCELPATQSGAVIDFSDDVVKKCFEVYQREVISGNYRFCGPWVDGWEYGDNCVALPLKSVLLRWDILSRYGMKFCSLFGMGGKHFAAMDRYPQKEWYSAIEEATKQRIRKLKLKEDILADLNYTIGHCCGDNTAFISGSIADNRPIDFSCSDSITGCHVVLDRKAIFPMTEEKEICIVPLCTNHSGMSPKLDWIGTGYYMEANKYTPALVIPFRLCGAAIEDYLKEHNMC